MMLSFVDTHIIATISPNPAEFDCSSDPVNHFFPRKVHMNVPGSRTKPQNYCTSHPVSSYLRLLCLSSLFMNISQRFSPHLLICVSSHLCAQFHIHCHTFVFSPKLRYHSFLLHDWRLLYLFVIRVISAFCFCPPPRFDASNLLPDRCALHLLLPAHHLCAAPLYFGDHLLPLNGALCLFECMLLFVSSRIWRASSGARCLIIYIFVLIQNCNTFLPTRYNFSNADLTPFFLCVIVLRVQ